MRQNQEKRTDQLALDDGHVSDREIHVISRGQDDCVKAFHEAGHALAAIFLGHILVSVDIIADDQEGIGGRCVWDQRDEGDWFDDQSTLVCTAAGDLAMRMSPAYRPMDDYRSTIDHRKMQENAENIHREVSDDEARASVVKETIEHAVYTAESILLSPCGRSALYDLATALLEKKALTGEEAMAVVRQAGKYEPAPCD